MESFGGDGLYNGFKPARSGKIFGETLPKAFA